MNLSRGSLVEVGRRHSGLQLLLLSVVFDIGIERDILGRGLWWLLGR